VGYPIFTVGGISTLVSGVYFTFTGEDDEESGSSVEIINNSSSNSSVDGYMAVTGLGGIALLVLGDHLLQSANKATGEKNKLNQKIELLKKDSVAKPAP
jgi:hypothetical protein